MVTLQRIAVCLGKGLGQFAAAMGISDGIYYINGPETLPAPLGKEEERELFDRLREGSEFAKQQLITHNLRLVVYIAKKFESTGIGIEDLISIGSIGLIKAVSTFCPDKKIKLATYASRCIENEILMFLRKTQTLKNEVSIDEPLNIDWDGNELLLSDILGSEPNTVNRDREKQIMQMRFGLLDGVERTQKEVADLIGISQSYISRLEKRIIKKLRGDLERQS